MKRPIDSPEVIGSIVRVLTKDERYQNPSEEVARPAKAVAWASVTQSSIRMADPKSYDHDFPYGTNGLLVVDTQHCDDLGQLFNKVIFNERLVWVKNTDVCVEKRATT